MSSQGNYPKLSRCVSGIPRFLIRKKGGSKSEIREEASFEDGGWIHEPKNSGSL